MSPGLVHCHSSVIVSRQMNPTSGCPCPPEPRFRMTARWSLQTPDSNPAHLHGAPGFLLPAPSLPICRRMPDLLLLELALLGLCSGFLAGLLAGGGMVLVPFLTYFLDKRGVGPDLSVKMAIATAMATIVFTSTPACAPTTVAAPCAGTSCAAWRRASSRAVCWPAWESSHCCVASTWRCSLACSSATWRCACCAATASPRPRALPGPLGLYGAGTGLGFISGLVGAGGPSSACPS